MKNIFLNKTDSTNSFAKANVPLQPLRSMTCVIARKQTHGRGRFERSWQSPRGNLYMTFCFTLAKTSDINCLGLLLACSACRVLQKYGIRPQIRWPNDLLIDSQKIGGILCETTTTETYLQIFLGVGLNINTAPSLSNTCSLSQKSGKNYAIEEILQKLQIQFSEDLLIFIKDGFKPFAAPIEKLLAYKNEIVSYKDDQHTWQGKVLSLSLEGLLNLQLPSGEIKTLCSATFSQNDLR